MRLLSPGRKESVFIGYREEYSMKPKEKILVFITVMMVVILLAAAFYDRSPALLRRTLAYELPDDVKLVDIDKHGFMFYRVGYEAKFEINPENPEEILSCFLDGYDFSGSMLSYNEYKGLETELFSDSMYSYVKLRPDPVAGSGVWSMEVITEDDHDILHFIDLEEGEHSYLYIYYVR